LSNILALQKKQSRKETLRPRLRPPFPLRLNCCVRQTDAVCFACQNIHSNSIWLNQEAHFWPQKETGL
jgi:hypothetical protein